MKSIKRRTVLAAGASIVALGMAGVPRARAKTKLRFSGAFTEQDPRADAYKALAQAVKDEFEIELYFNNTLFKQGTELVAMERGNLEMCNLAPADIAKQVPAWTLMTSAYLFRDVEHLEKTYKSAPGKEMIKLAKDKLGVQVITPVYFGTRQVNLKPDRKIETPKDMAGIKLRMPPGEVWQFLGEAIGANPTPVAFSEVYTALQTGAIDGQDNPLVLSKLMKFYEVTTQFVLTSHLVGHDVMAMDSKVWNAMTPAQQARFQSAAEKSIKISTSAFNGQEQDAAAFFKAQGLKLYKPDVAAFRTYAQKKYLDKYGADWPKGMLERINAIA